MYDNVIVDGKWRFDCEVANCFEDMLQRSIPQYETLRKLTFEIGREFVVPDANIVDLGCSNGLSVELFVERFSAQNKYILIDVSESMLDKCRDKYRRYISNGIVDVRNYNICDSFNFYDTSLILSILTLQFTPIEYRQQIMTNVYNSLIDGGAFVFVEKVIGNGSCIDNLLVRKYYDIKKENQYTEEAIRIKRKSLEGVLVPVTAKWNEELLYTAGFRKVDCFWRYLNFAGWIAIK